MATAVHDKLKRSLQAADALYYRLVLVVGESGSGKTSVLHEVAADLGTDVVNAKLTETGFVELHGTGRGRTYTLSAILYRRSGEKAEYIRQAGFASIQQEQMVLNYIDKHGGIKREDAMELCRLSKDQAYRLLNKLVKAGQIRFQDKGKGGGLCVFPEPGSVARGRIRAPRESCRGNARAARIITRTTTQYTYNPLPGLVFSQQRLLACETSASRHSREQAFLSEPKGL